MAAAAATTVIHPLSRAEAEEALRIRPMQPILRTCSYTPTYPRVHAITYRAMNEETGEIQVLHSLMELDLSGPVYELRVTGGGIPVRTGHTYESIQQLMQIVQRQQRRLLLHAESLPPTVEAAIVIANAAEHSSDLDEEVMHQAAARVAEQELMRG
jgi:hypothetical protein